MTNPNALIVRFPEELATINKVELLTSLHDIGLELEELAKQKLELMKQRKLLEVVQWVLFPDTIEAADRSVAITVQARLRRARELKEGKGKTKDESYRAIADNVTSETKKISHKMISKCCGESTFSGERHDAGDRYCLKCEQSCVWQGIQNIKSIPEIK